MAPIATDNLPEGETITVDGGGNLSIWDISAESVATEEAEEPSIFSRISNAEAHLRETIEAEMAKL
jgi:hypothetical protein